MSILSHSVLFSECVAQEPAPSPIAESLLGSAVRHQEHHLKELGHFVEDAQKRLDETKNPVFGTRFPTTGELQRVGKQNRFVIYSKDHWELQVRERKNKLRELKDKLRKTYEDPSPCLNMRDLEVGQVGFMGFPSYDFAPSKVVQVLGPDSMLVSCIDLTFLVQDYPTGGIVDGKTVVLDRPVEVMGTKTYPTALGGSNTVYVLRPVSQAEYDEAMKYVALNKIQRPREFRTWTNATGDFTVEAEYVSQDKKTVKLAKRDGAEVNVEIAKLGKTDRVWLKEKLEGE